MTTIAYKDGIMAADTQATGYSEIGRVQKLWRLPDGGVVGFCGEARRGYAGAKWFVDGEKGDPPNVEGALFLIARPDGTIWTAEDELPAYPTLAKFAAHGCGLHGALLAMGLGQSAVDAIFSVCEMDALTSPPIQSLEVVPAREFPPLKTHTRPSKAAKRARPARKRATK